MKTMTRTTITAIALLFSTQILAETDFGQVIGDVNGEEITLGEALVFKSQLPQELLNLPAPQLAKQILEQISVQKILAEKAEDTETLRLSIEIQERSAKANSALQDYIEENLTEDYLHTVYDDVIGTTPDETEWLASHILVDTKDEALDAIKRINDGEEFSDVANEISKDGNGEGGGDLGWFGKGRMVPEFESAVASLDKGGISEPVQSQFGWHVINLVDTRTAKKPTYEEVLPQLEEYAGSLLVEDYVKSIVAENEITPAEDFNPFLLDEELPQ